MAAKKVTLVSKTYKAVNFFDRFEVEVSKHLVQRLKRGEASPCSDITPNASHLGYLHTIHIAASRSQPDRFKRIATLKDGSQVEEEEIKTGPKQALIWERVRILAVTAKVSVCGCGSPWSEHGNMNAQPRCWQLLDVDEPLTKMQRQPLYIFYDDYNVCFVDQRLNCLYVQRSDLVWGGEEDEKPRPEHHQQQEEVNKEDVYSESLLPALLLEDEEEPPVLPDITSKRKASSSQDHQLNHNNNNSMGLKLKVPKKPERSWSTETVWSGDINAPFVDANALPPGPALPDLMPDYNPHWNPNDWFGL